MSQTILSPKYVLFCDDIRREDNGKYILVGLYSGNLVVPSYPAPIGLSFMLRGEFSEPGSVDFKIRVLYGPGELELFTVNARIETMLSPFGGRDFEIVVAGVVFQAQRDGYISLQLQQNGEAWAEAGRLIVFSSSAASSITPPPSS